MFERYKSREKLEKSIDELNEEYDLLIDELRRVKDYIAELKQSGKMENEAVSHIVTIKKAELDLEHKERNLDQEQELFALNTQNEYQKKLEAVLKQQVKDVKQMYTSVLDVLRDKK